MTVERLIELLEKEYAQAQVLIKANIEAGIPHWDRFHECFVFDPYHVQPNSRAGTVTILCDQHDC